MYTSKKWIALVSRANDSCLMIGKDDLLKVAHCGTTSDPYGPRHKRGYLRPVGPSLCEALRRSSLHTADRRNQALVRHDDCRYPPQQAIRLKAGVGIFLFK